MASGDSNDIVQRVRRLIPSRWFKWDAPIRDAVLGGVADGAAWCFSWISYARQQSRIATSSGIFLDLTAWDFFGIRFRRRSGESDAQFQPRIGKEILRPRSTRAAVSLALSDLTGQTATVQEPWNPQDWGGYGLGYSGYGSGLGYGSLQFPNQIFVKAVRPNAEGIPNVAGYGTAASGYGVGAGCYCDLSQIVGPITDAEIYATVAQTISAGVTAWVDITSVGNVAGSMVMIGSQGTAMTVLQSWY